MGEVEPSDAETRADEAFQHVRSVGRWSDRGNDFGLVVGERHHSSTDAQPQPARILFSICAIYPLSIPPMIPHDYERCLLVKDPIVAAISAAGP
jgi:hypothetical protein